LLRTSARERIARINTLQIRLLGDAVLRRRAWELAFELGLDTTYRRARRSRALQKGTLVSTDAQLLERVRDIVPTATVGVVG
jgi:hypothetical protein